MTWSADVVADDWRHINASEVVRRAIARLDEKGKGILLLHDIQPATALALPELLRELKAKGYRIVQVVPGKGETSVPVAAESAPTPAEAAPIARNGASPAAVAAVEPAVAPPAPAPHVDTPAEPRRQKPRCPRPPPTVSRAAKTSRTTRCGRSPRGRSPRATCRRRASSSPPSRAAGRPSSACRCRGRRHRRVVALGAPGPDAGRALPVDALTPTSSSTVSGL